MSLVCSLPCVVNANERIMEKIFSTCDLANARRNRVQGKFRLSRSELSREAREVGEGRVSPSHPPRPSRETVLPVLLLGFWSQNVL